MSSSHPSVSSQEQGVGVGLGVVGVEVGGVVGFEVGGVVGFGTLDGLLEGWEEDEGPVVGVLLSFVVGAVVPSGDVGVVVEPGVLLPGHDG